MFNIIVPMRLKRKFKKPYTYYTYCEYIQINDSYCVRNDSRQLGCTVRDALVGRTFLCEYLNYSVRHTGKHNNMISIIIVIEKKSKKVKGCY